MPKLDNVFGRYDLKTLEAAMGRRRDKEMRQLSDTIAKLQSGMSRLAAKKRGATGKPLRRPNARRLNEISLADAIVRVMQSRKKAVHYKDLTDTIVRKRLYRTKSKNLLSTVAVTLKRDRRFKKVEPGYYALR
jgi:hypothetical protein